jgi:hypothetical protein
VGYGSAQFEHSWRRRGWFRSGPAEFMEEKEMENETKKNA